MRNSRPLLVPKAGADVSHSRQLPEHQTALFQSDGFWGSSCLKVLSVRGVRRYSIVSVIHLPYFSDHTCLITYSRVGRAKAVDDVEHHAVRNAIKSPAARCGSNAGEKFHTVPLHQPLGCHNAA